MKLVGWDLYIMKLICYVGGAVSKDVRWFIVAAMFTIAHELRHIWDKEEDESNES